MASRLKLKRDEIDILFQEETAFIEKNRESASRIDNLEDAKVEINKLIDQYEKLLRQTKKTIRLGDIQQQKMRLTNLMLNEFADELQGRVAKAEQIIDVQDKKLHVSSRLATLGEVAGGVAHDINNPMAVILTEAEFLKNNLGSGKVSTEKAIQLLEKIIRMTHRVANIIRAVKSVARDGDKEPMQEVKFASILAEAMEVVEYRLKSAQIKVETSINPEDLTIFSRPTLVMQALVNLLNNAHDAIESFHDKWIKIDAAIGEDRLLNISVTDCGKGIPAEEREKILTEFYTTKEVGKGTGLGLSIVQKVAREHGGELMIDGGNKNTCFVLSVPTLKKAS